MFSGNNKRIIPYGNNEIKCWHITAGLILMILSLVPGMIVMNENKNISDKCYYFIHETCSTGRLSKNNGNELINSLKNDNITVDIKIHYNSEQVDTFSYLEDDILLHRGDTITIDYDGGVFARRGLTGMIYMYRKDG